MVLNEKDRLTLKQEYSVERGRKRTGWGGVRDHW